MVKNRHLSKSISDASWSTFVNLLLYKAEEDKTKFLSIGGYFFIMRKSTFSLQDFIQWEATSQDTVDFKGIYVDVCQGDTLAGLMLSQIIFWHLPKPKKYGGKGIYGEKISVKRQNKLWLMKTREDWYSECRLSPRVADRCQEKLIKLGLIEKEVFHFNGVPKTHIHLNAIELMNRIRHLLENPEFIGNYEMVKSISRNGEVHITDPLYGNNETVKYYIRNTETTTENTNRDQKPHSPLSGSECVLDLPLLSIIDTENVPTIDDDNAINENKEQPLTQSETESTEQNTKSSGQPRSVKSTIPEDSLFHSRFWPDQLKKVEKKRAMRAWLAAGLEKDKEKALAVCVAWEKQLEFYKTKDPRYIKHPSSWLNGECWNDELFTGGVGSVVVKVDTPKAARTKNYSEEEVKARLDRLRLEHVEDPEDGFLKKRIVDRFSGKNYDNFNDSIIDAEYEILEEIA